MQVSIDILRDADPSWTDALQIGGDLLTAVIAGCAVVVSVMAYKRSAADASQALKLQAKLAVNDRMSRYLDSYLHLLRSGHLTHKVSEYVRKDPVVRMEHKVVVGQLIMLVSAMYDANDDRADIWLHYIGVMEGPLWEPSALEAYTAEPTTHAWVLAKQAEILKAKPYLPGLLNPGEKRRRREAPAAS